MGLIEILITAALALLVRRNWPGIVWLGLVAILNLAPFIFLPATDPRLPTLMPNLVIQLGVYGIFRAIRWRKNPDVDLNGSLIWTWQIGSLATLVYLLAFDGVRYTWWNWLVIVPINLFLAEIWPLYWLIIRPFSG